MHRRHRRSARMPISAPQTPPPAPPSRRDPPPHRPGRGRHAPSRWYGFTPPERYSFRPPLTISRQTDLEAISLLRTFKKYPDNMKNPPEEGGLPSPTKATKGQSPGTHRSAIRGTNPRSQAYLFDNPHGPRHWLTKKASEAKFTHSQSTLWDCKKQQPQLGNAN